MGQSSVEMMHVSKAPDSFSSTDGVALDCHIHCSHHSRNISAFHAQTNALIRAKATISKQQAYNLNLHPVRSTFPTAMKMSKCNNCGLSRQGASSCNEMRRHNEGVAQNRSISPLLRKKKVNVVLWRFGCACLANFPSCSLLNIIREGMNYQREM